MMTTTGTSKHTLLEMKRLLVITTMTMNILFTSCDFRMILLKRLSRNLRNRNSSFSTQTSSANNKYIDVYITYKRIQYINLYKKRDIRTHKIHEWVFRSCVSFPKDIFDAKPTSPPSMPHNFRSQIFFIWVG